LANKTAVLPDPLSEPHMESSHTPLQGMDGGATPLFFDKNSIKDQWYRHKKSPQKRFWGPQLPYEIQTVQRYKKNQTTHLFFDG